jgi:hypothetical protein
MASDENIETHVPEKRLNQKYLELRETHPSPGENRKQTRKNNMIKTIHITGLLVLTREHWRVTEYFSGAVVECHSKDLVTGAFGVGRLTCQRFGGFK